MKEDSWVPGQDRPLRRSPATESRQKGVMTDYEFSDSRKEINLIALFGILLYFVYYFLCRFKDFHYHNGKDFFFSKMKRCEYLSFK